MDLSILERQLVGGDSDHLTGLVRDMNYDEDRSQIRTASGPRIMASLRNLAITILRLAGALSIAAALRHHARRPDHPMQTIMNC